jgi:hypothetical protein
MPFYHNLGDLKRARQILIWEHKQRGIRLIANIAKRDFGKQIAEQEARQATAAIKFVQRVESACMAAEDVRR